MLARTTSTDGVVTRYSYDSLGRTISTASNIDGTTLEIRSRFDDVGRLASLTYPALAGTSDRLSVDYVYNAHGYLAQVRDAAIGGTRYWQAEARNTFGQLERERFGNGVVTQRTHIPTNGLLTRLVTTGPGRIGMLDELLIGYDRNNNVEHRHETGSNRIRSTTYDSLDRLASWRLRHPLAAKNHDDLSLRRIRQPRQRGRRRPARTGPRVPIRPGRGTTARADRPQHPALYVRRGRTPDHRAAAQRAVQPRRAPGRDDLGQQRSHGVLLRR